MKINPTIFRAYDIRGIYPDDLNTEVAYRISRAFVKLFPHVKKLVLAYDPRLSSPFLAKSIKRGFLEENKEVIDIGIAPDSLFYFSIFHYGFDGGIMISGSHNPKNYNGLTLTVKESKNKVKDVIEKDLEKIKELVLYYKFKPSKRKGKIKKFNPENDYINYVVSKINLKRKLKIVIDTGNGSCGYLPEKIFKRLGCEAETIYAEFDGNFPHHLPDPYEEENLKDLKEKVLSKKADLGFAFDADGDRVGPIDNKGRSVGGDICLLLLSLQAIQKKKGPIVHDMRVSKAFLDEMKRRKIKTYFSVCHHNAIIDKVIKTKAVFGGETTLHFLFPLEYYLCDDAIFASLKISEIASHYKDFSSYLDFLLKRHRYYTSPEIFIPVKEEEKFKIIKKIIKYLKENNYNFIGIDGARINFKNGWALIRASNTSPFIKCRFEGKTKNDLLKIKKETKEILEKFGLIFNI
jgi:phosphomannomutase/phosphoglucomutase